MAHEIAYDPMRSASCGMWFGTWKKNRRCVMYRMHECGKAIQRVSVIFGWPRKEITINFTARIFSIHRDNGLRCITILPYMYKLNSFSSIASSALCACRKRKGEREKLCKELSPLSVDHLWAARKFFGNSNYFLKKDVRV